MFRPRADIERYSKDHARYIHGAWKTGVLDDLMRSISARSGEDVPPDLSLDEIRAIFTSLAGLIDLSVIVAPVPGRGRIPVGLVGSSEGERWAEPHVIWFPWASKRNRYEGAVTLLREKKGPMMVVTQPGDAAFWGRLKDMGLVKKVGSFGGVDLWGSE